MSWTSPRTWIAGEIVTAAELNTHVRDNLNAVVRELAYAQIVSTVVFAATPVEVVAAPTLSFDGSTAVMIQFYCSDFSSTSSGGAALVLYDNGASVAVISGNYSVTSLTWGAVNAFIRKVPSAGSHTFSIRGTSNGASNASVVAGDGVSGHSAPAFIRVLAAGS